MLSHKIRPHKIRPRTIRPHKIRLATLGAALALLSLPLAAQAAAPAAPAGQTDGAGSDHAVLAALYAGQDSRPLWDAAQQAAILRLLAEAPAQGLDAADFAVPPADAAQRAQLLTAAFLRYGRALAQGEVAEHAVDRDWLLSRPGFDAAKFLARARSEGPAAALAAVAPRSPGYERLVAALKRYRGYAQSGAWSDGLVLPNYLKPGDGGAPVTALRARLAAENYIGHGGGDEFDETLAAAVKHFQTQHGLPATGVVDRATLYALNVPPETRVQQIRLNLARLREMPRAALAATRVEVNAPAGQVVLYEDGRPTLTMRAITGSVRHPTPVLQASVGAIVFNPTWTVPSEIAAQELRPIERAHPGFLASHGYVASGGTFVQRPGPNNVLGQVKLDMPNSEDVYIHGTTVVMGFANTERDYSHGCVRVEEPRALAQALLAPAGWTVRRVWSTIGDGRHLHRVPLGHAVPAYLLYFTAWADADGGVQFRDDVYGRDARFARALTYPATASVAPLPPARAPLAVKGAAGAA